MSEKIEHPWYNFDKLFSYNALINIVAGGRGIGKTYGALKLAIRHGIERGEEFVYLRRYKSEIQKSSATFFTAVSAEFPDYDLRVNGGQGEFAHVSTRDDTKREWKVVCYFVALTQAQSYKGSDFTNVTKIIFDEFITEKGGQYRPSETDMLINFLSTADRYQDRAIVIMLANAVSIMNPYFIDWEIDPSDNKDGWVRRKVGDLNGAIVAHFPDSEAFKSSIYKTRLGKFIKGTDYAKYAVDNQFDDNKKSLVELKDPDAYYALSISTQRGRFSVWHNVYTDEFYAQRKQPKKTRDYTLDTERVARDVKLLTYNDPKLQMMRRAFNEGNMTFDNPRTRNVFAMVFKR